MSFEGFLRADTVQTIQLGPFLDTGDGNVFEDGMTLEDTEIWLSKDGGGFANPNDTNDATVDGSLGAYYTKQINATDTNTEGILKVVAKDAAALIAPQSYMVVNANVYDALYAAATTDYLQVDTIQVTGTGQTANNNAADINSILATVNHVDHGNAKLVRATTPANALDVSNTGEVGLDFDNFKVAGSAKTITNITIPVVTAVGTTTNSTAAETAIGNLHDFDPTSDDVAQVTLVVTTTTNSDMLTAANIWDTASALTTDFGTLIERAYQILNNKMSITDATGSVDLRAIGDGSSLATWGITDNDTLTIKTEGSW